MKKKIIYSLGLIGIVIPVATIISCGPNNESEKQEEEQEKLNAITSDQIWIYLNYQANLI